MLDLRTHKKADVIILQQVAHLVNIGETNIRVLVGYTNIFILLLY